MRKHSEEHKRKISLALKGHPVSKETREKISLGHKGLILGEKHFAWKGDEVGNDALHQWVKSHKIKSIVCDFCLKDKPLDLANKTGIYNRKFDNWLWLCRMCHSDYDLARGKKKKQPIYDDAQRLKIKKLAKKLYCLRHPERVKAQQKAYTLKNKKKKRLYDKMYKARKKKEREDGN